MAIFARTALRVLLPLRRLVRRSASEAFPAALSRRYPQRLGWVCEFCTTKRHYFVHVGNCIVLVAINQTDMLNLRMMSIAATSMGIMYNLLQPVPLVAPAAWGLFFISCHSFYILRLLRERQHIVLSLDKEQVYESAFMKYGFTPRQFCRLLEGAAASWRSFSQGAWLSRRGEPFQDIDFLIEGKVEVYTASGDLLKIVVPGRGAWLGEFYDPLLKMEEWNLRPVQSRCFSVRCASETCRTMSLSRRGIHEYLHSSPELRALGSDLQVDDLWGKLKAMAGDQRRITYRQMLKVALSDGVLVQGERELLQAWRQHHKISQEEHEQALEELGWSVQEFATGRRNKRPV